MWTPTAFVFLITGIFCNQLSNSIDQIIPSIYQEIAKKHEGNLIFSPFSSDVILLWLLTGARGDTATELQTTLKLPSIDDTTVRILQNVSSRAQIANKLYLKPSFQVKDDFKSKSLNTFHAEIENVDFSRTKVAADTINQWVAKHTNNKIQNLVDPNNLNDDTRALLVNVLYLQANWEHVFSPAVTKKFYTSETDVVETPMMSSGFVSNFYNYFECPHADAKFIEIPFEKEGVLTVILPNQKLGITDLEKDLSYVFSPQHAFTRERAHIVLPKFKIETEVDFKSVLQNLQVTKIFNADEADLSGISGDKGDLLVDKIIQKSFIRVNEKGIEAGAATYASVAVPLMGFRDPPKEFIADHPFIWYIKSNGVILFAGRVTSPDS